MDTGRIHALTKHPFENGNISFDDILIVLNNHMKSLSVFKFHMEQSKRLTNNLSFSDVNNASIFFNLNSLEEKVEKAVECKRIQQMN